jgi:dienelactone hydrolase
MSTRREILPQRSIRPRTDLREMLREHIVRRGLACMEASAARRARAAAAPETLAAYRSGIRAAVRGFYGDLPAGAGAPPPAAVTVSTQTYDGYRTENVLFDSFPGWPVNATVYVPTRFPPPYPVVVVPVGHNGKQCADAQLPCQYFARAGLLAICFDPPGQAGEKQPGNDHFLDGVRDYLVGQTSSRYFVADAIRCMDYAATRQDADASRGVAMTGVSGGGTTTLLATLLDDRVKVIGPTCCVAPLAALDISQGYCGCPETHPFGRCAKGIDDSDLLCAAAPRPCLLMAGRRDMIYRIADARAVAREASGFYAAAGAADRSAFVVDPGGHAYPLLHARRFVRFVNRWLLSDPGRAVPSLPKDLFALRPYDELRCHPRTDINMRTRAVAEADRLAAARDRSPAAVRRAAAFLAGVAGPAPIPAALTGRPFRVWSHDWRAVLLQPEPGIELPATLLTAREVQRGAAVLHFDDAGRHRLLYRQGPLAVLRFSDADRSGLHLLTVDLRGWGDTAPAMHPYEIACWSGLDRYMAYATAALGDPVMGMRTRDALAALAWLRSRAEADPDRVVLSGCGLGALVALQAAAVVGDIAGVVLWNTLSSFRSLIAAQSYPWPAETFVPNVLCHFDLPELAASVPAPVRVHNLRDGGGAAAGEGELAGWRAAANVLVSTADEPFSPGGAYARLLSGKA